MFPYLADWDRLITLEVPALLPTGLLLSGFLKTQRRLGSEILETPSKRSPLESQNGLQCPKRGQGLRFPPRPYDLPIVQERNQHEPPDGIPEGSRDQKTAQILYPGGFAFEDAYQDLSRSRDTVR